MRVPAVLVLAAALGLAACATTPDTPPLPPAAPPPAPVAVPELPPVQDATGLTGERLVAAPALPLPGAAADGTARLEAGGRPYLLAPARRLAPGAPAALLLVLPAANTTLREEYDRYALDALRDHGVTVAVVSTYAASWNAGRCCGRPVTDGVDDVAVVAAVRDDALARTGADATRVAAVGHSVGALMVWRLVCTPGSGLAAAVAVAGTLVHPCPRPLARVPDLLALHGQEDRSVPVDGSDRVVPLLGTSVPSVRAVAQEVAAAAGCDDERRTSTTVFRIGCAGGGSVRLTVLPGRGHAWEDLDATRRTARFLHEVLPHVR